MSLSSRKTICTVGTAAATLVGGSLAVGPSAHAATAPPYSSSFYAETADASTWYNLGCTHGKLDSERSGVQDSAEVIDAGAMHESGGTWYFSMYSGADEPVTKVVHAAEQYARGYYICTGGDTSDTTSVAIGTNNSTSSGVSSGAAIALGNAVDSFGSYVSANLNQVSVAGATDMELDWSSPDAAKSWIPAYKSATSHVYFDYGDAAGCSTTDYTANCNNTWTTHDVWYKSWGNPRAVPMPEIYTTSAQARQWREVSIHGAKQDGSALSFLATLTQHQACGCGSNTNTPSEGWQQLYGALNDSSVTAIHDSAIDSTDIKYVSP